MQLCFRSLVGFYESQRNSGGQGVSDPYNCLALTLREHCAKNDTKKMDWQAAGELTLLDDLQWLPAVRTGTKEK